MMISTMLSCRETGVSEQQMLMRLWAKTSRDGGNDRFHPLLYHMLDVAAVAGLVLSYCLISASRTTDSALNL